MNIFLGINPPELKRDVIVAEFRFIIKLFKDKIKVLEKRQTSIMWIKISKDTFSFNQDVYICIKYIPPSGSKVLRSNDIDIFEQLELDITKYKQLGKVYLTGDFNSRTSSESNCLDFDQYLDEEDSFINDFVLQPRVNKDHVLDAHGLRLLLLCQSSDLLIANKGVFTFIGILLAVTD